MSFNQASLSKLGLAGQAQFGQISPDLFQERLNIYRSLNTDKERDLIGPSLFQNLIPTADESLVKSLVEESRRRGSKEYQEEMLELADKYQTRKGVRQTAFNLFGSGMDNLMKGIGMSMNPYGTREGLQSYLALTAAAPQAMSAGYQGLRTPMNIPAVQVGSGPTYF